MRPFCRGMRSCIPFKDISEHVEKLEKEIEDWERVLALRSASKGNTVAGMDKQGNFDPTKSAHHEATSSAKLSQDEFRSTGGAIQLVGEDLVPHVAARGGTRMVVAVGMAQNSHPVERRRRPCMDPGGLVCRLRWTLHPVMVTRRGNGDYFSILLYSYYATIAYGRRRNL